VSHWDKHPHVRTGGQLSFGERAADALKLCFGTWTLLFGIIIAICLWMTLVSDPGELHLNLALSFLASVQGVILQIAANRGDRISAEVAFGTHRMAEELLELNRTQLQILTELHGLRAELGKTGKGGVT
jgi:uncharacterized membrane protein